MDLKRAIDLLSRTPSVVEKLLKGLDDDLVYSNEGGDSWSPFDIVGHLIHGEKTDWISRLDIILSNSEEKTFTPFNRFAQFEDSKGKSLQELLEEFSTRRSKNLDYLKSLPISEDDFKRTATHPSLGIVTLSELLSAWVAHDLGHIAQISRVMAKQYKDEVGPWLEYMSVLNDRI